MNSTLVVAAALLSLCARNAAAEDGEFARELRSIANADAIIAVKVDERRAELADTLARAYRSLRPRRDGAAVGFGSSRARARGWWRRLIRLRSHELRALEDELAKVRNNRASFERDEQRRFARPRRGSLRAPVKGAVVHRFGPYRHPSGARLRRRGMTFEVGSMATVVAPAAGRIRYSGPIRGLGSGVIVASDDGWWMVVGGVKVAAERVGAAVEQGQELGPAISRRVYLEVRVGPNGQAAVDPGPLLR